ncbi:MAG: extracellular solute-binding protein [Halanaerobiales bacterium]
MKLCNRTIYFVFILFIITFSIGLNIVQAAVRVDIHLNYDEYRDKYSIARTPDKEIILTADNLSNKSNNVEILRDFRGINQQVISTCEEGFVEWEFFVEEAGFYNIELRYFPVEGRRTDIERELYINGEIPFEGAKYLSFTRVWEAGGEILRDVNDNEIRPTQIENPFWKSTYIKDSMGYHPGVFDFYFKEGQNTIRLSSVAEPMVIDYLKIGQKRDIPTYSEVMDRYENEEIEELEDIFIKIQGEDARYKSNSTLFAIFDQGDPSAEPYHPSRIRLNAIGGHRWSNPGQWISWEFEVPKSGFYQIAIKAKQNLKQGFSSFRKLTIDGELPFQEMSAVSFQFSSKYLLNELKPAADEDLYLFYLEEGKHTLQLEVVLGDFVDVIKQTEESLYELSSIYRKIIMITSTRPDENRDYQLEQRIPGLINKLKEQSEIFKEMRVELEGYTGTGGGHKAFLQEIIHTLDRMYDKPYQIPRMLTRFKDQLGSLGNWLTESMKHPLTIDYIIVASPEMEMPRAAVSFTETLEHEMKAFAATFVNDYSQIGDINQEQSEMESEEEEEALKVWIGLGRDQGQVLKQMIEDTFTPETGIKVNLELIENMDQLLVPASLAGTGPDVAIGAAKMQLAFRGALVDLSDFEDFTEVSGRFKKSAFLPFTFRDSVYGLPETQGFPVMFYRKDILADLGLDVPQTWEDIYEILPILQRNNMTLGLADLTQINLAKPNLNTLLLFLYQKRIALYKEDGIATNLDSEATVQTINQVTDLYTLYNLEKEFNVQNYFRFGETPITITTYGLYNSLKVFAPELRGQWGIAPVPGTLEEDGTINRAVPVGEAQLIMANPQSGMASQDAVAAVPQGTTGSVILSISDKKEKAWEFLKWWTRSDTQVRFGLELESLMGSAARYATANVEAMKQLPWGPEERETLMEQWEWVEGIPPVLGGYYVGRQFDWLFRAVVLDNEPVRETIQKYNRAANAEITRKRREFGLETDYQDLVDKWKNLYWQNYSIVNKLDLEEYQELEDKIDKPEDIFDLEGGQ